MADCLLLKKTTGISKANAAYKLSRKPKEEPVENRTKGEWRWKREGEAMAESLKVKKVADGRAPGGLLARE